MMRTEPAWLARLGRAIEWTVAAAGGFVVVLVFYNVLSRFFLKTDVAWSSEVCTLLLIWMTFVGGAIAARFNAHLAVTEFVMVLSARPRARVDAFVLICSILTLGVLTWFGVTLTLFSWPGTSVTLNISNGWWYMAMPVGCALMLVFVTEQLVAVLSTGRPLSQITAEPGRE